jgi:hypothetical protein
MYSVETEIDALNEVAALPVKALPAYAELMTLFGSGSVVGRPIQLAAS